MRAGTIAAAVALAELVSAAVSSSALAEDWQVSEHLARVQGISLYLAVDGRAPCDFVRDKLLTSAKFVLNSANMPFDPDPKTDEGEDRSKWGMVVVEAHALDAEAACVWTLQTTLYGPLDGGEVFGLPSGPRPIQLWTSSAYGAARGNGLTSYVSEYQDTHLKRLMNDIFESRKRYPS